jgi:hypothetical protein
MTRQFTPQQIANGILTTFSRGNYSLAVSRMRAVEGDKDRDQVINIVRRSLTKEELSVLQRYARDLF